MNPFDKICIVLAFIFGIILLVLGIPGIIFGCRAHFSLPPVFGGIPALVGWGIIKAFIVASRTEKASRVDGVFEER